MWSARSVSIVTRTRFGFDAGSGFLVAAHTEVTLMASREASRADFKRISVCFTKLYAARSCGRSGAKMLC